MRYHTEKPKTYTRKHGKTYYCNHPVYDRCTLYLDKNGKGLAVIQQRFKNKKTYWEAIDPWLNDILYSNPGFNEYFNKYAGDCTDGIYPTVTVRSIMNSLRIKPLYKNSWETVFDRRLI